MQPTEQTITNKFNYDRLYNYSQQNTKKITMALETIGTIKSDSKLIFLHQRTKPAVTAA